jgi:hypothetical protein
MKFTIEQIAICPKDPAAARKLLEEIGAVSWADDHVSAKGAVQGVRGENEADLAFNYDIFSGKEFEILHYTEGRNWMQDAERQNSVSHLGMHCSAEDLVKWREFFSQRNIPVAQEVMTQKHTNPVIAGERWYNYVIFDTKAILGVDLKFIVRLGAPGAC